MDSEWCTPIHGKWHTGQNNSILTVSWIRLSIFSSQLYCQWFWMLCNPWILILLCMSTVQFCCRFWPFNFTYGCIVCLAGPWIRVPYLESCWDKKPWDSHPISQFRQNMTDQRSPRWKWVSLHIQSMHSWKWLFGTVASCDFPTDTFVLEGTQRSGC